MAYLWSDLRKHKWGSWDNVTEMGVLGCVTELVTSAGNQGSVPLVTSEISCRTYLRTAPPRDGEVGVFIHCYCPPWLKVGLGVVNLCFWLEHNPVAPENILRRRDGERQVGWCLCAWELTTSVASEVKGGPRRCGVGLQRCLLYHPI